MGLDSQSQGVTHRRSMAEGDGSTVFNLLPVLFIGVKGSDCMKGWKEFNLKADIKKMM